MLQFIKGPSGSGKTTTLYEQIIKRSSEYPQKTFLLIVPEQNNLSALKQIIEMTPGKGILNIDVLSFNRLAHRIFDEAGGNDREILDDTAKVLILRHLADKYEDSLGILSGKLKKPGFINEVKSVISEFMQYDITLSKVQQMLAASKGSPALFNKLNDIAIIYDQFSQYCKDKYITTEEVLDRAIELAPKADFLTECEIYLDGYTGYTPVQLRFLSQIMQQAGRIVTTVIIGDDGDKDLFDMGFKMIKALSEVANDNDFGIEEDICLKGVKRFEGNAELEFLEKNIFRYNGAHYKGQVKNLAVEEFANVYDEIRALAKDINAEIRTNGLRYREVCVLTGDMNTYGKLLKRELLRLDIPVFLDESVNITLNPFIELIRSAIECRIYDLNYESLVRFMRCGMGMLSVDEIDRADNYIKAAGIKRAYQYNKPFTYVPRYMGNSLSEDGDIPKQLEEINAIRVKLLEALSFLKDEEKPAKEHTKDLYDFIVYNRVYEKLREYEEEFKASKDYLHEREYAQIYENVMALLDKIVDFVGDEVVSLSEYLKLLEAGLSSIKVGMIPPGVDEVTIGDMERSRISGIRSLFIVGCNEGSIPKDTRKGGILSEDDRELLLSNDFKLSPTTKELISQDKFYIYMNISQSSQRVKFSYPLSSAIGNALRPSTLIAEIRRLFDDVKLASRLVNTGDSAIAERLLLYYLDNDDDAEKLKDIIIKAQMKGGKRRIAPDLAQKLYGDALRASVTRLEKYNSCPYSHFLKYGLKLTEAEEYGFRVNDMGTVFHDVLQDYSMRLTESDFSWFDISKEKSDELLEASIAEIGRKNADSAIFESSRSAYSFKRIKRICSRAVDVLTTQVRCGSFVPSGFEVPFNVKINDKLTLTGRVDRIDTFETKNNTYLKIIDYKSGNKDFSLSDVYNGLNLQLATYLAATEEIYIKKKNDADIKSAALLYYHVDDPLIERDISDEQADIKEKLLKALKMKGIVNADTDVIYALDHDIDGTSKVIPVMIKSDGEVSAGKSSVATDEEFEVLKSYVNYSLNKSTDEIMEGNADIEPYLMGKDRSGCDYCRYGDICNFYNGSCGNYKVLDNLSSEEAFEEMENRINGI